MDENNGDAWILKRNNPLAIIEGAAGELNWLKEGGTWWIG